MPILESHFTFDKGHINHPKKVTKELPGYACFTDPFLQAFQGRLPAEPKKTSLGL